MKGLSEDIEQMSVCTRCLYSSDAAVLLLHWCHVDVGGHIMCRMQDAGSSGGVVEKVSVPDLKKRLNAPFKKN